MIARHLADGRWAEHYAKTHLENSGLKLVETNFSSRFGEIDLIMKDRQTLVFVEVRMRKNHQFGHPAESIGWAKRGRIRKTAECFLKLQTAKHDECRFDVVAITGDRHQQKIEWIRDAFC